ncbi:ER membrane protein complex subunit 8-like [Mizuhopecten yessoensis]|uniref:ER membrane protein complex subunit 8-like n=1 Tax=Mizuhopecten yessoensis TaxID=6573 RepID=UPI000B457344|nr:ER membrane protein complex subunit 8-like [Mizuhopecten yessoensis]
MAEITVSMRAYCKLLLHAAKYPHCSVNGVLLAENSKSKEHRNLRFVDCVPLFHLTLGLSPMLEAALLQIDGYCKSAGYVIAGYYQANENYSDSELNCIARVVGRRVSENCQDSCIFMIDNKRVSPESVAEVYRTYSLKDTSWRENEKRSTVDEETMETAATLLTSGAYTQLTDFDNHFDDLTNDWLNTPINDMIKRCT